MGLFDLFKKAKTEPEPIPAEKKFVFDPSFLTTSFNIHRLAGYRTDLLEEHFETLDDGPFTPAQRKKLDDFVNQMNGKIFYKYDDVKKLLHIESKVFKVMLGSFIEHDMVPCIAKYTNNKVIEVEINWNHKEKEIITDEEKLKEYLPAIKLP